MKIKSITFGLLLFTILGCNDCKKDIDILKDKLFKTRTNLEKCNSKKVDLVQEYEILKYVPIQKNKPMKNSELGKYENFELKNIKSNKFKTNKNHIDLTIPVSSEYLKIVDIINVSSNTINAIIVLLDGNEGGVTINKPASHFITSKPKIDKISGLDKEKLKNHKNLVIYVLHDNEFSGCIKQLIIDCVSSLNTSYPGPDEEITCSLKDLCINKAVPREIKGDIVSGN